MALKGFGYGVEGELADKQRASLNLDWYYGWSADYPGSPEGFVPMIWGGGKVDASIKTVQSQLHETKASHLLGFNEPDLKSSSYKQQSNMTVKEAADLWPKLQATGLRLGSPATIKPDAEWMDAFMRKAKYRGLRVDFLTMHCYGWPNAEDFLRKVTELHERYDKPVWVTEFAVADFKATSTKKNRYSRTQVNEFMEEAVKGLNALPFVERYAWKTRASKDPKMGTSALFHTDGTLTSTGELYASL